MDRFGGMPLRLPWGYLKKHWRGGESGVEEFHTDVKSGLIQIVSI